MLMAHEKGAALIVSVGAHFNLVEFLDRKRGGMSSTFLTRLKIGERLVDAKGVSRLYNPSSTLAPLLFFAVAFLVLLTILVHHLARPQRRLRTRLAEDPHLARHRLSTPGH